MDEICDRYYREARGELNESIIRGFARMRSAVGNSFSVLNRIEYSEPWTRPVKKARGH
jgi:hypothetical protein